LKEIMHISSVTIHPLGCSLSYETCAEHECGIQHMRNYLGDSYKGSVIGNPLLGLDRRAVPCNDKVHYHQGALWVGNAAHKPAFERNYGQTTVARGSWDDEAFVVFTPNAAEYPLLREGAEAARKGTLVLCAGDIPELNVPQKGLHILFRDKLPKTLIERWTATDKESHDLHKAWEREGGEKLLKTLTKAGKQWYSLGKSLAWDHRTGKLIVWLNPMEQGLYQAGWFGIEDLKEWAKDKGAVLRPK